jgi:hypothetical protein
VVGLLHDDILDVHRLEPRAVRARATNLQGRNLQSKPKFASSSSLKSGTCK